MNQVVDVESLSKIYRLYQSNDYYFPLIAAVLTQQQDGIVFADKVESPSCVYVEHSFGFSHFFSGSKISSKGGKQFESFLLSRMSKNAKKIRLYWTLDHGFRLAKDPRCSLSLRQRFIMNKGLFRSKQRIAPSIHTNSMQVYTTGVSDLRHLSELEETFGVVNRFWHSEKEFCRHSLATIVLHNDVLASVCYAAANVSGFAEVDIATRSDLQGRGFGMTAATAFIERCLELDIAPMWDCFTNNEPSMRLAQALGFTPQNRPYEFYTISPSKAA